MVMKGRAFHSQLQTLVEVESLPTQKLYQCHCCTNKNNWQEFPCLNSYKYPPRMGELAVLSVKNNSDMIFLDNFISFRGSPIITPPKLSWVVGCDPSEVEKHLTGAIFSKVYHKGCGCFGAIIVKQEIKLPKKRKKAKFRNR